VLLPSIDDKQALSGPAGIADAGKERGWFFRPEPGDEVVVGFLHDDAAPGGDPGAMYGSKIRRLLICRS